MIVLVDFKKERRISNIILYRRKKMIKKRIVIIGLVGMSMLMLMPSVIAMNISDLYSYIYSLKQATDTILLFAWLAAGLAIVIIIFLVVMCYYLSKIAKLLQRGTYRRYP